MSRDGSLLVFAPRWLIVGVLSVGACTSLDDSFRVTPFLREQITGDTRRACLAREYQMQTHFVVRDNRDWLEASRFSAKGWTALEGDEVRHWTAVQFGLEKTRVGSEQLELEVALSEADADPCNCAKAEAAYDGWLAAAARGADNQGQVEKNFSDALAVCRRKKE
jgi:hypothetical protein